MKRLVFFLLFLPFVASTQIVQPDTSQLNFGDVFVGERDTLQLTLNNTSLDTLRITNVKFYTIYNETPFSVSENAFTIQANGSYSIDVYFEPIQNILHNSELVLQHNAKSGVEAIDLKGQGRFPLTYYDTTENLVEEDLKKALNWRLAQGYKQATYNAARDEMFMEIDNEKNNGQGATTNTLECVYTGNTKTGYTSRSNAQSTTPNFNTEHTFPQGLFSSSLPERSDLHHLFPTTNTSNSQRGSKPFGTVSNPTYNVGGSKGNSTTFEPRNDQKGSTARAMMYFVLRYEDFSNHFSTQETILRDWHGTYPPDSVEERRNEDISDFQKNRNPFVDYPQLEERITNFVTNSVAPKQNGLDVLQTSIDFGTILNQQKDTFDYVLVNRGNTTLDFSNFSLSNTTILSFADNSGLDTSILPGDALEISVIVETTNASLIDEDLTFSTNIPGSLGNFTIPIKGNSIIVSIEEESLVGKIKIFPNPLQEQLFIRTEGEHQLDIRLLDALGREIDIEFLQKQQDDFILSTKDLSKGIYFIELREKQERLIQKLVK